MSNPSDFSILDAVQESVFVLNRDRQVVFANRVAREVFGGHFIGSDFIRIFRHPDCIAVVDAAISDRQNGEVTVTIDHPVRVIYRILVSALNGERDNGAVIVSLNDISNVHEAEQMRTDFVANVSHELRSPLTAITGFVETLKGSARDDAVARVRFLDLLEQESRRMVRLIADLLSLSKVEATQRVRPAGTANIAQILRQVENTLASVAVAETKTIRIDVLDDTNVPGSTDELIQVFQNILENAIKYGRPDSEISVRVHREDRLAGFTGAALQVDIVDQGDGIAREHIGRLTERFYRVDSHRSRDKGGTGLGLAIVKHIVSRHRGRLKITSQAGVGSTFTVILPTQ